MAKKKKDKGGDGEEPTQVHTAGGTQLRLADHPRAQRSIARAKALGGLLVFAVTIVLSVRADVPLTDALGRGIVGGIGGYVAAWAGAVLVWKQLAAAELELARKRLVASLLKEHGLAKPGGDA
jgi:hypothetical protein